MYFWRENVDEEGGARMEWDAHDYSILNVPQEESNRSRGGNMNEVCW